jgi:uncharacterized protein (DUF885 family)
VGSKAMKKRRLMKSVAKRNKKTAFKAELKALRKLAMINNQPISGDKLIEYQIAKEQLIKEWYDDKYSKA